MRISDMLSMGKDFLILGAGAAVAFLVLVILGYGLFYKKILKGKRVITKGKFIWAAIFACYLIVVLGATMFSRGSWFENKNIAPLFYSYREALVKFTPRLWRNIILNILLFVPFGFLLPVGIKKMEAFWKTWLAGFLFTVCIEVLQLVLKRGIFEPDDILNNTLGAMIGFGLFAIFKGLSERKADAQNDILQIESEWERESLYSWVWIKNGGKGKKRFSLGKVIVLQLPLLAALAFFGTAFLLYSQQELGNLSSVCIVPVEQKKLEVLSEETYDAESKELTVYKVKKLTETETREFAEAFFTAQGDSLDESRTDLYDETAMYYGLEQSSLGIEYLGGTYRYTDFATTFAEPAIDVNDGATDEELRKVLGSYGIVLPERGIFMNKGDGQYFLQADKWAEDQVMYEGTLSCEYYVNGKMGSIDNQILQCELYGDFEAISEQEAYEKIRSGKFQYYVGGADKLTVELGKVKLSYETDSKGFYQPVYRFQALVNGGECELTVPALR